MYPSTTTGGVLQQAGLWPFVAGIDGMLEMERAATCGGWEDCESCRAVRQVEILEEKVRAGLWFLAALTSGENTADRAEVLVLSLAD